MLQIFQEAVKTEIPKLSEIPLYQTFDKANKNASSSEGVITLTEGIGYELSHLEDIIVEKSVIEEMLSSALYKGNQITRSAVDAYKSGDIIITFNSDGSKVPRLLPYIVVDNNGSFKAIIFSDRFLSKIPSDETENLSAVLEAAYLSLLISKNPEAFFNNSQLMLSLCDIYANMATYPIENVKNIKGDNLNKIYLYVIAYFYSMFRDEVTETNTPYKKIVLDKVDPIIASQIFSEVSEKKPKSFYELTEMMVKLNPASRDFYTLPSTYNNLFFNACGLLIFALEYIPYLFLIITTSIHHCVGINLYGFNKHINLRCKKVMVQLLTLVNSYQ